jgi:phosphoglycolate phosphatase-like HAD superfamily hydrolase
MIELKNKKNIFWDFDGVIMDSMPVRNKGFKLVLRDFPKHQVDLLIDFHLKNGGLSRYVKFRHFFENIRNETISEKEVQEWANRFSFVMRKELIRSDLLIKDSLNFIKKNNKKYRMHIVSGSDGQELNFLCKSLYISQFFVSIFGSPTPKKELVKSLLNEHKYPSESCILIGDSINDYEAAIENSIEFAGYNNPNLKTLESMYISEFSEE